MTELPLALFWAKTNKQEHEVVFPSPLGLYALRASNPGLETALNPSQLYLRSVDPNRKVYAFFDNDCSLQAARAISHSPLNGNAIAITGHRLPASALGAFDEAYSATRNEVGECILPAELRLAPRPLKGQIYVESENRTHSIGSLFSRYPTADMLSIDESFIATTSSTGAIVASDSFSKLLQDYRDQNITKLMIFASSECRLSQLDYSGFEVHLFCRPACLPGFLAGRVRPASINIWMNPEDLPLEITLPDYPLKSIVHLPVGVPGFSPGNTRSLVTSLRKRGVGDIRFRWYFPEPNTQQWVEYKRKYRLFSESFPPNAADPVFCATEWSDTEIDRYRNAIAMQDSRPLNGSTNPHSERLSTRADSSLSVSAHRPLCIGQSLGEGSLSCELEERSTYPYFQIAGESPIHLCDQNLNRIFNSSVYKGAMARSMEYANAVKGKRVRCMFALALGAEYELPLDAALLIGTVAELAHLASLLQDDLPCMDNDRYRRGSRALHTVFGESMAILTSDAILILAIQQLNSYADCEKARSLLDAFLTVLGPDGLAGGQADDLAARGKKLSIKQAALIHYRKTGVLFEYIGRATAILAELNNSESQALADTMGAIGLSYQIADDLKDKKASKRRYRAADEANGALNFEQILGSNEHESAVFQIPAVAEHPKLGASRVIQSLVERISAIN